MTILYSLTLVVWAFVANFFQKHINIFVILLINSYCLGFIDRDNFGILNIFDLNALSLIIYIYYIVTNFSFQKLKNSLFVNSFLLLLVLYGFGVIYPFICGNSSLFYSIKEGKEFIHYLAFFATYLSIKSQKDIDWAWRYVFFLSFYYGCLEIAYSFGLYKLDILHYLYRKDAVIGIVKVYQPIFAIVFLTLFYFLWKAILIKAKNYFQIIFLLITALFTAFRAYILGSFIAVGSALIVIFRGKYLLKLLGVYSLIIFAGLIIISLTVSGSISERLVTNFDNYISSGVREFVTQKGGSLEGRMSVNKFRWEYFKQHPFFGYGFIDKYSTLGKEIYRKNRAELFMIDTGYLDVLLKFGILGSILFYGIFIRNAFLTAQIVKQNNDARIQIQGAALFCFIVTLLASQVTHAGLTFSFGIIPLAVGLGIFDCQHYIEIRGN